MQDSHSCDPGSIPGRRNYITFYFQWVFRISFYSVHFISFVFSKLHSLPYFHGFLLVVDCNIVILFSKNVPWSFVFLRKNIDAERRSKSLETELSIAICRPIGDKWQSKTLLLAIFDPRSTIVKSVFDCRLSCVQFRSKPSLKIADTPATTPIQSWLAQRFHSSKNVMGVRHVRASCSKCQTYVLIQVNPAPVDQSRNYTVQK